PPAMTGCGRDYMPAWLVPGVCGGGRYANVAGKLTRCVAVNEKGRPNGQPQTFAVRQLSGHCLLQVLIDLVEETGGGKPRLIRTDEQCEILGHVTCFDRADANIFKGLGELSQLFIAVELGTMGKATGPCEDRSDGVGGGLFAALVLAVVTGHCAVCRFSFNSLAIRRHQNGSHQAERTVSLSNRVGLDVAVVVLTCPDVAAGPLEAGSHHVVDQAMFVGDVCFLELVGELSFVDLLEDVLEAAVIDLENRILRGKVHGIAE